MADITLVNLNMLFIRYGEEAERELHVPLGPLYLTRALEDAGFFCVDNLPPQLIDSFASTIRAVEIRSFCFCHKYRYIIVLPSI